MKRKSMKLKKLKVETIFIYVLFLFTMLLTIRNKTNLHIDEVCSYILSNSTNDIVMEFEEGYTYIPEMIYLDNMAVMETGNQFNFSNVWLNQTKDVHPPLYYFILHIICSINIGKFSIWYAGVINICFALLTLYILRKFMHLFLTDTVVINLGSILFALSVGTLQNVSFLRMYVMAMFWVTLIAFYFIKVIELKFTWKLYLQIGLIGIVAALTHYYCIIYLCATCLVFGICLLIERRWKDMAALIISMAAAAIISIIIFPAMLTHMFSGYRGTQSIDNLTQGTWTEYWGRIKSFYGYINMQVLGGMGGGLIVFVLLLFLGCIVFPKKRDKRIVIPERKEIMKWLIVGIPSVIYFVFVSKSAVYITDRYLFPIYAIIFAMFWCGVNIISVKIVEKKYILVVLCLIGSMLIVNGFKNADWSYLYKQSEDLLNRAKTYSDENCIYVYDVKWKAQPDFFEVINYKSVTFISQENSNGILQKENLMNDSFILKIVGGNDEKIIHMILDGVSYLDQYEKIGECMYGTTYRIFASTPVVQIYNYDGSRVIGADGNTYGSNVLLTANEQPLRLNRVEKDYIMIELDGLVLDVAEGKYAEGTNIQLYLPNETDAQKWKIVEHDDGSCSLFAKDERFALTCGEDGDIYLSEYHEEKSEQKWWIRENPELNF